MHPIPGTIHWVIARANGEVIKGLLGWIRDEMRGHRFGEEALVLRAEDYGPLADYNALGGMLADGAWSETLGGDVRPAPPATGPLVDPEEGRRGD
jgi:hypothetical protein